MRNVREELVKYGRKLVEARLVAGAGGNISARDGNVIWMKPSGVAMDELSPAGLCGVDIRNGRQVRGKGRPTSEINMHLAVYRLRPDVNAVFHTHSPWATGVITAGVPFKPMFAEVYADLGRLGSIPYVTPMTPKLAEAIGARAPACDTILMTGHGILATGATMKQAYYRCLLLENAAISLVAASVVGKPQYISAAQIRQLERLEAPQYRKNIVEGGCR